MRYEEPGPIERSKALQALASNDAGEVCRALISVVLHDPDRQWAQERCIGCAAHSSVEVRRSAATCIGHVARIHRRLDLDRIVPVLRELGRDPAVHPYVENALDDIRTFMGVECAL